EKYSIPVRLPLQEEEIAAAKKDFEAKLAKYKADLKLLQEKEHFLQAQGRVMRTMRVANFGFYNHDIFYKKKNVVPLLARFNFGEQYEIFEDEILVYLITAEGRAVVTFNSQQRDKFKFSPEDENQLLAVLPNNKAMVFTKNDFKREMDSMKDAEGNPYVFQMSATEKEIHSPEDISALLAMD
ncbi:MAG: hypothetical protein AAF985_27055, partial [Bacteroidota bacterium]